MQQRIDLQNQLLLSPETPVFCPRGQEKEEEEEKEMNPTASLQRAQYCRA